MSATGNSHQLVPPAGPRDDVTADERGEVLTADHAQARLLAESGDVTGARTLLEETLADAEARHGRDHPQLAPLMVDLATIARHVGNLTEAQNQLRRAYGIMIATVGAEHATSLSIEGRLAAVNFRLGEPTEAYDWHIADVGARVLGADHPAVRGAQQRLAATPVGEVQAPPPDRPGDWPSSYATLGYVSRDAEYPMTEGDDAGGWAPAYVPSPTNPGVYDRRVESAGVRVVEPRPRDLGRDRAPREVDYGWPVLHGDGRPRGHLGGVALVASFGLAIIAAAGVIAYQLLGPGAATSAPGGPDQTSPATAASASSTATPSVAPSTAYAGTGLPPGQVTVRDDGTFVTLSWLDPSGGRVPFVVSGGRTGDEATPIVTVPAGRTEQRVYGLNPRYDYCFTVAAVWSTDLVQPSPQTCTTRSSTPTSS
jgi:hypothetical protein